MEQKEIQAKIHSLSKRELQVVKMVSSGYRNHAIATALSLSLFTVRQHVSRALRKLDLGDRFELAIFSYAFGLAEVPTFSTYQNLNTSLNLDKPGQRRRRKKLAIGRLLRRIRVSPSGCWEWSGSVSSNGYGTFGITEYGGSISCHRYSYLYFIGAIPSGFEIDHICRNRRCVSPFYLEAVTRTENARRKPNTYENAKACRKGHLISETGLYISSDGKRRCLKCRQETSRQQYLKKTTLASITEVEP